MLVAVLFASLTFCPCNTCTQRRRAPGWAPHREGTEVAVQ